MNLLTPDDALRWFDGALAEFPEKIPDGEVTSSMLWKTTNIVRDHRDAFVGALRIWLQRRTLPWLALELAVHHRLTELRPDFEAVALAMEQGDGFPTYYREFVPRLRMILERL